MQLSLDTARNKLLTVSTIFGLISMCVGMGALVGSIFGMNLKNGFEVGQTLLHLSDLLFSLTLPVDICILSTHNLHGA